MSEQVLHDSALDLLVDDDLEVVVVALAGVRKSGKDTVGQYLERFEDFHHTSFAAPLKEMAKIAFPQLTHEQLYGSSEHREEELDIPLRGLDPRTGASMDQLVIDDPVIGPPTHWMAKDGVAYGKYLTPRLILQTLGTEWGRRLHTDIWGDACWGNLIARTNHPWQRWVITDCRFRNEVEGTKRRGGVVVKLLRGFEEAKERLESGNNADIHPSEAEFLSMKDSEFDYVLPNTGTLEELPKLIDDMWLAMCPLAMRRRLEVVSKVEDLDL